VEGSGTGLNSMSVMAPELVRSNLNFIMPCQRDGLAKKAVERSWKELSP